MGVLACGAAVFAGFILCRIVASCLVHPDQCPVYLTHPVCALQTVLLQVLMSARATGSRRTTSASHQAQIGECRQSSQQGCFSREHRQAVLVKAGHKVCCLSGNHWPGPCQCVGVQPLQRRCAARVSHALTCVCVPHLVDCAVARQLFLFCVLVCVHRDNLDWSSAPAIQEMPVVSAICEPTQQQVCLSPYPMLQL